MTMEEAWETYRADAGIPDDHSTDTYLKRMAFQAGWRALSQEMQA